MKRSDRFLFIIIIRIYYEKYDNKSQVIFNKFSKKFDIWSKNEQLEII